MSVGPGPALGSHRCAHTCAGDTLTARSQDAPPEGDSKRVIHSLPNVNAQPSQLRRMALTPEESASIAAHRARRPATSVLPWGGPVLGLLSISASGVLLQTPRALEDHASHPCQLQASLPCPAHDPPHEHHARPALSVWTLRSLGGTFPSLAAVRAACVSSSAWSFEHMVFMFLILSLFPLNSLRIFIKHSVI